MKLWSCFNPDYIEEKFNVLKEEVIELNLWQNFEDHREKFTGVFIEVGTDNCKIRLDDKYKAAYGKINIQLPLYVHSNTDDMLFRRDIYNIDGNNIISFKTPYEVMFRDKRVSERFTYKYQDYKNISLTINEDPKIHSYILTDISTAGLSFVIPESDANLINKKDTLSIRGLTDQELGSDLKAKIIYINPFKLSRESDSKLLHIGVQFDAGLDSVSYKSVSSIVKKKVQKVKGLDTDKFNGLNPEEFEKTIRTIQATNSVLAANIREKVEDLDRLRYLTIEMKREFLLEVNHDLLAASLRLSSKELIFDLLSEVTDSIRDEFLYKLDEPKPASAINKAQEQICKFIHEKEASGEIILDPRSYIKYV